MSGPYCCCFYLCPLILFLGFDIVESHQIGDQHWRPATATWYGSPEGDGSDGGACGYGDLVDVRPLKARVGAVSPVLFKDGEPHHLLSTGRDGDHNGRVPRRLLRFWPYAL
ncbi:uncharacterized protein A4U43_C10F9030 [Asparagus officinalis]|uniref:Expansin-like EG45 domain-containing protein n=1 Tax=Asparagus officinalis TaxID=4686 RepID=A0A5P1E1W1_ASPOF|nr:uncharacterized protein A4U43_C10F9030 [Asparagus officinalis]